MHSRTRLAKELIGSICRTLLNTNKFKGTIALMYGSGLNELNHDLENMVILRSGGVLEKFEVGQTLKHKKIDA